MARGRRGAANPPSIAAILGRTGTGKSLSAARAIAGARRLLVWDFKREHGAAVDLQTSSLAEACRATRASTWRVAVTPSMIDSVRERQFELFCELAYVRGRAVVLVEELAFVTRPYKAPPRWRLLTMTGRHEAVRIIGTSQRPASIDKDFLGNASIIRTFAVAYPVDAAAVAAPLGVRAEEVLSLEVTDTGAEFIERKGGVTRRGRLRYPR